MPTVLRIDGYDFYFYADENREPMHVHVENAEREAKCWLEPVSLVWNEGFRDSEITKIARAVRDNKAFLIQAWLDFFKAKNEKNKEGEKT